jgi:hypothetical protein
MVTQDPDGLDYPGPTRYVLRRRERSSLWGIFFILAFPIPFLTMVVWGWLIRYSSVVEVIIFGLFFLGMIWIARDNWKDRAAVVGQVLLVVGDAGVYLADPSRHIPWSEVAGLVAFRTCPDGDSDTWLSRLVVVRPGEDCLPGAVARQLSGPDQWGAVVELHDEKLRLRDLAAAVHAYAPALPVWDAGAIKDERVKDKGKRQIEGQAG